ncbi:MgtC/SapB family protein [Aquibacillus koreensis]|uniref:MgtC/SapB family protein n=1 Tax=Aquibacillus koreensis TaxID=279446 RepID=A0A9X3WMD4_9BACI|nr:MgtC/SapB family protein [Aquibacillus koreensis]MCT2536635.1 MgtC/SapB family protein [Aquibacillus koreensis]MDC3422417.1 MgtC/SapB family protein [Aquibacillus koreensis]
MDFLTTYVFDEQFRLIASRILVALVLSGLIGFERELKNHSAGFRTHILVGVGSCLMMLLSLYGFEEFINNYDNVRFDPARIPSYVISGIGFLGAGTIIVNGMTIRGLTTAASIWAVAGLGLVVGVGMYGEALFTTLVILLSLVFLNKFELRFHKGRGKISFQILIGPDMNMGDLLKVLDQFDTKIRKLEVEKDSGVNRNILIQLDNGTHIDDLQLYDYISKIEHVIQVTEIQ